MKTGPTDLNTIQGLTNLFRPIVIQYNYLLLLKLLHEADSHKKNKKKPQQ